MKILIGVPCSDTIKSRTAFSLLNLDKGDFETRFVFQMGCDIAHNRNKLAMMAIEEDFTHVLFVDSDMVFNPDMLIKLLKHDKDIIAVPYNKRRLPRESVVSPLETKDFGKNIPQGLFEVAAAGTGLMLIKTEVFHALNYPFFDFSYRDVMTRIGEDVHFCEMARKEGFSIWVDTAIQGAHIGDFQY